MLDELHVTNLALIREANLLPAAGLTAVTGETGAGKTALLLALALVAGERAEAGMVREGSPELQVEARFVFGSGEVQTGETIVQRQLSSDGRSRVHIDGSIATVGQLAEGVGRSVDFCGQHEHQRLMHVAQHRNMLDTWGYSEIAECLHAYTEAFEAARCAAETLQNIREAGQQSAEALEAARFTLARIDEVAPEENEYEELRSALSRAENAEILAQQLNGAHEALSGEGGALDGIGLAITALNDISRHDPSLARLAETLQEASSIVEDTSREVRQHKDSIDYDAASLRSMQERMGQLQGLLRSYGPSFEEVFAARSRAQERIAAVDEFETKLANATKEVRATEEALVHAAEQLHAQHTKMAPVFSQEVSTVMQQLELKGSALVCDVRMQERQHWTATGPDHIEFLFQAAAGVSPRPLVRIASGGEISRVMLAIKVVLGAADEVDTLIFDEVDAGVGGSAARALAEVLATLAQTHQVIVVTHLAQVAVLAQTHYVVQKTTGDVPETKLEEVRGQARVTEIARMLSGDTGGVSRAHAAKMLEEAHHLHTH